jgi:hypothetical protein
MKVVVDAVLAKPLELRLPNGGPGPTVLLATQTVATAEAAKHDWSLTKPAPANVATVLDPETVEALGRLASSDVCGAELAARSLLPEGWQQSLVWVETAANRLLVAPRLVVDGLVRVRLTNAERGPGLRPDLAPAAVEVTADPGLLDDREALVELIGLLVTSLAVQRLNRATLVERHREAAGKLFARALNQPVTAAEVAAALGLKVTVGA